MRTGASRLATLLVTATTVTACAIGAGGESLGPLVPWHGGFDPQAAISHCLQLGPQGVQLNGQALVFTVGGLPDLDDVSPLEVTFETPPAATEGPVEVAFVLHTERDSLTRSDPLPFNDMDDPSALEERLSAYEPQALPHTTQLHPEDRFQVSALVSFREPVEPGTTASVAVDEIPYVVQGQRHGFPVNIDIFVAAEEPYTAPSACDPLMEES